MEQAVDQRGGEAVALEPAQLLVEGVSLLGRLEAVDPLLGGREGDAVTRLARLELEGDGGVAFSRSGRPEEADVGPLLDPGEPGEVEDERALGRRLGGEVEVLERLLGRKPGVADAPASARGIAGLG